MVSSMTTIIRTDVVQVGMTSNIHISAAKTNMAIVLCSVTVSPSIPKNVDGTNHRKSVIATITGSIT